MPQIPKRTAGHCNRHVARKILSFFRRYRPRREFVLQPSLPCARISHHPTRFIAFVTHIPITFNEVSMSVRTTIFVVLAAVVAALQSFELAFALQAGKSDFAAVKGIIVAACIGYIVRAFMSRKPKVGPAS